MKINEIEMSVKFSGHRDSTTHRKEEGNIFLIMLGLSAPAPNTIFKNKTREIEKLNMEIPVVPVSRCPVCPDNFTLINRV